MKLSQSQEKALIRAEKSIRVANRLWWQTIIFIAAWVGIWMYFDQDKQVVIGFLASALASLIGVFWRTHGALSDLLYAFRLAVNADPQALAQQYAAKFGDGDPDSLKP
jgi:hypothetical protein